MDNCIFGKGSKRISIDRELNLIISQLKQAHDTQRTSIRDSFGADYNRKKDHEYWVKAAMFWQQHQSKIASSLDDKQCVCMEKTVWSRYAGDTSATLQRVASWEMYNYGSRDYQPFGELVRLDQVINILKRIPEWRLPTEEEFLAFRNPEKYNIVHDNSSATIHSLLTGEELLFPSVHPQIKPSYWTATVMEQLMPLDTKCSPSYIICEITSKNQINSHYVGDQKKSSLLYDDRSTPRALLRPIRKTI